LSTFTAAAAASWLSSRLSAAMAASLFNSRFNSTSLAVKEEKR
jgi:hypothetical protein